MGRINEELAKQKGLIIDGNTQKYDELVKVYKYLLEYFISTKIDLSKYEDMIKNSGLYIGVNDKYKPLNEYLKLDYIFLITNLFVEKLSLEDISVLEKFDKNNIADEIIDVIRRTYKDVIYDNFFKGEYQNIKYNVCYGPMVPINFVDNDAIAFKIYYGKNLIDLDGEAFIELHKKQLSFFDELINKFKEEVKEKLDINCGVLLEKDIY